MGGPVPPPPWSSCPLAALTWVPQPGPPAIGPVPWERSQGQGRRHKSPLAGEDPAPGREQGPPAALGDRGPTSLQAPQGQWGWGWSQGSSDTCAPEPFIGRTTNTEMGDGGGWWGGMRGSPRPRSGVVRHVGSVPAGGGEGTALTRPHTCGPRHPPPAGGQGPAQALAVAPARADRGPGAREPAHRGCRQRSPVLPTGGAAWPAPPGRDPAPPGYLVLPGFVWVFHRGSVPPAQGVAGTPMSGGGAQKEVSCRA